MSKPLSTIRKLMAEYKMGFVIGDKDVNAHYDAFEAQLRSLVEKFAEELIGADDYYDSKEAKHIRSQQRQKKTELLNKIFGGRDE